MRGTFSGKQHFDWSIEDLKFEMEVTAVLKQIVQEARQKIPNRRLGHII